MLKYVDTEVTFAEVPDHITLCINISNCPCHCEGCHSAYLAEDIGTPLTIQALDNLVKNNKGISCIAFMGGDSDTSHIVTLANWVKTHTNLKVAWYSGKSKLNKEINSKLEWFDFIKLGPYIKEYGSLNCNTTNQRFYRVVQVSKNRKKLFDITYKFWKHEVEN